MALSPNELYSAGFRSPKSIPSLKGQTFAWFCSSPRGIGVICAAGRRVSPYAIIFVPFRNKRGKAVRTKKTSRLRSLCYCCTRSSYDLLRVSFCPRPSPLAKGWASVRAGRVSLVLAGHRMTSSSNRLSRDRSDRSSRAGVSLALALYPVDRNLW